MRQADGRLGWAQAVPYDLTAATDDLEPAWLQQLWPQGILLALLLLAAWGKIGAYAGLGAGPVGKTFLALFCGPS